MVSERAWILGYTYISCLVIKWNEVVYSHLTAYILGKFSVIKLYKYI